jgi:ferrous iron transport protein A
MSEDTKPDAGEPRSADASQSAMPLMLTSAGDEVILAKVNGGRRLLHRLAEMGLRPGVRFRVLSKGSPGPCIVTVMGARMVIGQGMAHRMFVRPE